MRRISTTARGLLLVAYSGTWVGWPRAMKGYPWWSQIPFYVGWLALLAFFLKGALDDGKRDYVRNAVESYALPQRRIENKVVSVADVIVAVRARARREKKTLYQNWEDDATVFACRVLF